MFIGHYGVAFAAKKLAPKTSLGTLFIGAQLIDLLWPIFLLLGIEHVRLEPGNTAVTPLDFYDYPFSHSLVGCLFWSLLLFFVYYIIKRNLRNSLILGGCVLSHWVLDFITHRPDLPLSPGLHYLFGLGLWNNLWISVIAELLIFTAGIYIYLRTTYALNKTGSISLWVLIVILLLIYFSNIFGPPPPNVQVIAIAGNASWLFVLWAYWIDRNRSAISEI